MPNIIQETFGTAIIEAMRNFTKLDIPTVPNLLLNEFSHVKNVDLKNTIAETYYGARWIYKLGLALLVKDVEQMVHVRTQVMDYGAVCEGLLSDVIFFMLDNNRMQGTKYQFQDPINYTKSINWDTGDKMVKIRKQSFYWLIEVAREEGVIENILKDRLHDLRKERNTIHMRERTYRAFIGTSKKIYETVHITIRQTAGWYRAHP